MKKDKGVGAVCTKDMSYPPSPYKDCTAHFTLHINACMPSVTLQRRDIQRHMFRKTWTA